MKTRTFQFPSNQSLGKLYFRSGDHSDWVEFVEACGSVSVPDDADLRLVILDNRSTNLSPLSSFKSDDIQILEIACSDVEDNQLQYIEHLTGLIGLALWETNLGDLALSYITGMVLLQLLDIGDTKITDDGLSYLASLVSLKELSLLNTHISNKGLAYLEKLPNLKRLDLMGTKINDTSISELEKLKSLKSLRIYDTNISEAGYTAIKRALPECQIRYKHPHYHEGHPDYDDNPDF